MKYLKLFEAFESSKLSKVLNFLNKSSKSKFLKEVKGVCDYLDYPLSKLTDDDFEYVPYQRAKSINRPDADGKIELIKFWFDRDGNYVSKTLINGKQLNYDPLSKEFSTDKYNYTFGRQLDIGDLRSLPNGTKVYLECGDGSGVGYLYNYSGSSYILQDFAYGTTPPDDYKYREIKPQSWIISSCEDYHEMRLAYPKVNVLTDVEEGGDFNLGFTWTLTNDNQINFYNGDFKDANFALILDLTKLKELSLKDIRKEREVRKERAFLTDKEIKKENIERYLNKILGADNFLSNPDKLIKRMLGGDEILFLLYTTSLISTLDKIENYYYQILKTDDEDEIKLQKYNIEQTAQSHYKKMKNTKDVISKNIQTLFNDISTEAWDIGNYLNDYRGDDEIDQVISDVVEEVKLLQQLSKEVFDNIGKIENIYDIESLRYKLGNIDRLLSSKRDNTYKLRDYLLRHFHSDKNTFYTVVFRKQYNEPRNFIENIYPRLEQVIKRL
jgi:hypothetical protein